MITIKTPSEIKKMREAGRIAAGALERVEALIKPGTTTAALNRAAHEYITGNGAVPSFLNYKGYPASITVSINNEVIHGIPDSRRIVEGDVVSVDVGACKNGYHGDAARTFAAGKVTAEAQALIDATRDSFYEGMKFARAGKHLYEISAAIQKFVESKGYSVIRDFIGHGVGRRLHEPPDVPNFKPRGRGPLLASGMTLAVEPMVTVGGYDVVILANGWTVETADKSLAAHYENTVLITDGDPELLTL